MTYRGLLALGVASLAACGNVSGHVSSTKLGDTSHPAPRRSPVEDLRAACGDGAPTPYGAKALQRQPYLQQVSLAGAKLGWVSADTDERVAVTVPEGLPVSIVPGVREELSLRTAGEKQIWSTIESLEPATTYCYQLHD